MRTLIKPSTAQCTLEHYTAFLLAEPYSAGWSALAEVADGADLLLRRARRGGPVGWLTGRDHARMNGVR